MAINKMHSTSIIKNSVLSVHEGIFNIWFLTLDIKNKDRFSPMSTGNNFVVTSYQVEPHKIATWRGQMLKKKISNFIWFNRRGSKQHQWKTGLLQLFKDHNHQYLTYNIIQCLANLSMQQLISIFLVHFLNSKKLSKSGIS